MFARKPEAKPRRTRRPKTHRPALIRKWRIVIIAAALAFVSVYVAFAAISLSTAVAYTQNFDSLNIPLSSPTPSNLPADFRVLTLSVPRTVGSFSSGSTQT
jgi:hypothetical protein